MRSDICIKGAACAQVDLYNWLNQLPYPSKGTQAWGIAVSIADVVLDTLKHPGVVVEGSCMGMVNVLGAPCSSRYSLRDAWTSAKLAATATLTTFVAVGILIPKWAFQTGKTLFDPKEIRSSNEDAEKQAQFQWVIV